MYFAAAVLAVLSGVFYAAGHHELGSFSGDVCRYGGAFCDNQLIVCRRRPCRRLGRVCQRPLERPFQPGIGSSAVMPPCPVVCRPPKLQPFVGGTKVLLPRFSKTRPSPAVHNGACRG